MSDYDADVQHLAEYRLSEPPYRAMGEEHERRVHSLALAIQRTVDAWIDSHPIGVKVKRRERWVREYP
jgi:hypothetical protein